MEYTEKNEPKYICPQCSIFCTVAEVYFENNHEKETLDQTGYGTIGTKRKIPDVVKRFVQYDMNYLEKLPQEIQDSIYLALFEQGRKDLKELKLDHCEQVLSKLSHSKGDQYYADLLTHSYSIFCALRGAPLIEFNDEDLINTICETIERFNTFWSELRPADRIRSVSSMVAFPFTLLSLGYPKEIVYQFYSNDQFGNFCVDETLFIQISDKMMIHPPILFSTICPKNLSSGKPSKASDDLFSEESFGFSMEISPTAAKISIIKPPEEKPKPTPKKQVIAQIAPSKAKPTSLPKLGFKILK
jgi:hypothetical protein